MIKYDLSTDVKITLNDGNVMPTLGLGTVHEGDAPDVKNQVVAAVRAGYRHIDTAWYYGSEKYVGEALKQIQEEGIAKREDLFITTKVWPSFHHHPERSIDDSLKELGIDYIDMVLQHWPICLSGDANGLPPTPFDNKGKLIYDDDPVNGTGYIKFYNRLEDYKFNTEKVKSIGVSNYSISRLELLLKNRKRYIPVVNQIEYHPQLPQKDLVNFCENNGIIVEAYSPLGGTGAPVLRAPMINELAAKYQVSPNEIAIAYHILEGRSVLIRSSNLGRIKTNIKLPPLTLEELASLYDVGVKRPTRYTNDPWGYGLGFKWWEGDTLSK
ncbi:D-arabinose 1-dehydrogenase (NAD(P)(+)) [Yamadazyma tenuis]|uniref:D-arabinose dehydrogenase n=1 Tax=Candida tenuis (strain ATCC 10573 / BCRC 21748 / CBS 615 / JCM 9827 / NBRC 10315 / NRRL Y-1498 / VKM Y-70) TaxID=590646 RepID=G3B1W6_CANTC|nr:D-arabinose dehydrogenase [Yamadazyma tenuis ATCC 10573]EGV64546.1 D-arabinose dehydrogenase [Yamadazyma tenuis ATCC 10573]WEJ97309.1 D-arabinose 1-dehydrogenase (NAD(P)(+)) [Yamadazyma tenuis]